MMTGRAIHVALLALAGLAFAINQSLHGFTHDDAYISLRYLDQWLAGNGLVYNPGERVEGYSNLFWILLLAPFRALGLGAEPVLIGGGLLATLGAAIAAALVAARAVASPQRRTAATVAASMVVGSACFAYWSRSGMETMGFIALIGFSAAQLIGKRPRSAALLLVAVAMTRPEGVALGGLWLGLWAYWELRSKGDPRRVVAVFMLFILPIGVLLLCRFGYYGDWLPNTYYAKVGGRALGQRLLTGATYAGFWLITGGLLLLAAGALGTWRHAWRPGASIGPVASDAGQTQTARALWLLSSGCLFFIAYTLSVGGDFMVFSRFLAPAEFLCIVLTAIVLSPSAVAGGATAVLFMLNSAVAPAIAGWDMDYEKKLRLQQQPTRSFIHEALAVQSLDRPPLVAVVAAGWLPAVEPTWKFIDMLGLNDRTIAREGRTDNLIGRRFTGHDRALGGYVCARSPDIFVPAGGVALWARSAREAEAIASGGFVADRDFVRHCGNRYVPISKQVAPDYYSVLWVPRDTPAAARFASSGEGEMHPKALNEQGVQLLQIGRLAEAGSAFRRAAQAAPDVPTYWSNLGFVLLDTKDPSAALAAFETALRVAPDHPEALYGRGLALISLDRPQEAAPSLQRFVSLPETQSPILARFREKALTLLAFLPGR